MRTYVLYAFELRDSVAKRRGIPPRISVEPYVYVGYTSKSRRERLDEHGVGRYVADRKWAKHYNRARFDLNAGWPTYKTQDEALAGESGLAEALRERGFTVVNKTGRPLSIAPKTS